MLLLEFSCDVVTSYEGVLQYGIPELTNRGT